ncbi:MAG TPA: pseudouridine synthase [Vicinamibacterales bacterium]|nr:pseudouridine synthase [Vicinamibacterales bacterium]
MTDAMGAKGLPRRSDGKGRAKAGAKGKGIEKARKVALVRALSKLGLASRSQAYELVRSGKVEVNGRIVTDPATQVAAGLTRIHVAGVEAEPAMWLCIALNKPRKVVTTRSDPDGRPTVYDLISDVDARVVPVGRLDLASTGLLLMTNDTELADWLTDPATAIVRRYVVTVRGELSDERAASLVKGIVDAGERLKATSIDILKRSKRETHLIVELAEGKNREIRRLLKAAGHETTRLKRIAFGGIELGELAPGKWRNVPVEEIRKSFPRARIGGQG